MTALPLEIKENAIKQIKVPTVNGGTFPKKVEGQLYQVVRLIYPSEVKEADEKLGQTWGDHRVGIQLLGGFERYSEANEYAKSLTQVEDWSDYYVVKMYEWIPCPPESDVPTADDGEFMEVKRENQPILQQFMGAHQKRLVKEAQLMELRMDMAKNGGDGATDVMLPDHKKFTLETRIQQLKDILDAKEGTYPEMMVKTAEKKLTEVEKELEEFLAANEK